MMNPQSSPQEPENSSSWIVKLLSIVLISLLLLATVATGVL